MIRFLFVSPFVIPLATISVPDLYRKILSPGCILLLIFPKDQKGSSFVFSKHILIVFFAVTNIRINDIVALFNVFKRVILHSKRVEFKILTGQKGVHVINSKRKIISNALII
jgi:hypothetical protein